ncbi:DUF2252 domain-containing protein [Aquibacillus kalidii]|uniref:DUF2252 domain-containing protein n=1 Tax=Aquibacillus kalidii TaxID=2762597 RepID=UPI0016482C77|nr:DUF2252 family protein [Aquibacillus kalidii]
MKEQIKNTKKYLRKQTLHTILEQFDDHLMQLSKSDRRLKYDKMKQDPYSFFRGSAYLFYYDVTKIPFTYHTSDYAPTWIMGDLHFDNHSGFQNEDEDIVFDVDDFDEGYLGSYLYDVLRMVVSIRLFSEQQGYNEEKQDEWVNTYLNAYYKQLKKFVEEENSPLTSQYTVENTKGPVKKLLKKLEDRQATHELDKLTYIQADGERKFNRANEKLEPASNNEYRDLMKNWHLYLESIDKECYQGDEHYQIKDIVRRKGAGIGSTGLKRFYVLIEGQHDNKHQDDIILEVKEARTPIPAYFFTYNEAFWESHNHQGKRVISTQQAMHHKADPYLGYFTINNREFYVRERSPFEKELKPNHFKEEKDIKKTVKVMGKVSAKIHARADEDIEHGLLDYHSEQQILAAIGGDKSGFKKEMIIWSSYYKDRVKADYVLFNEWLEEYFYKR